MEKQVNDPYRSEHTHDIGDNADRNGMSCCSDAHGAKIDS